MMAHAINKLMFCCSKNILASFVCSFQIAKVCFCNVLMILCKIIGTVAKFISSKIPKQELTNIFLF